MRVRWTPEAVENLTDIRDFVVRDSPRYAALIVERLIASVEQLELFPESGRRLPERPADDDLRELVRPPYRIVYRLAGETVHIVLIFRSSLPLPEVPDTPRR